MAEKKNYDSEFCGNLPLHNINLIQDYGYLIVLDKHTLNIVQVSENLTEITGLAAQDLMNLPLAGFITDSDFRKISDAMAKGITDKIPLMVSWTKSGFQNAYHVLMHVKTEYIILELQKADTKQERTFTDVYQEIKHIALALDAANSIQEVCEIAVHELRKISGFDGVLMYRFDKDWNGTVVAEEKDERLQPYIGQSFPASDVPKQARALYLKNPYRLIPNRDYVQSRLYPVINPLSHAFIDLSACNLRSVPAVHLEYMKNMQIMASMSIRVIKDEQLWGLISCHHITPKYLDYGICSVFEWLSGLISSRVSSILNKEIYDITLSLQQKQVSLIDQVYAKDDIAEGLLGDSEINVVNLFDAGGAAVLLNGRMEVMGNVPDR
ncbi:MAG: GAF domain-containing protein, partial [Pedobacter sp.]